MADELIKNIQMKAVVDGQRINAYPVTTIENVTGLSEALSNKATTSDIQTALGNTIRLSNVGTLSSSKKYALVPGSSAGVYTLSEVVEGSGSGEDDPTPVEPVVADTVWTVLDTSEAVSAFMTEENVGKLVFYAGESFEDIFKDSLYRVISEENDQEVEYSLDLIYASADKTGDILANITTDVSQLKNDVIELQENSGSGSSSSDGSCVIKKTDFNEDTLVDKTYYVHEGEEVRVLEGPKPYTIDVVDSNKKDTYYLSEMDMAHLYMIFFDESSDNEYGLKSDFINFNKELGYDWSGEDNFEDLIEENRSPDLAKFLGSFKSESGRELKFGLKYAEFIENGTYTFDTSTQAISADLLGNGVSLVLDSSSDKLTLTENGIDYVFDQFTPVDSELGGKYTYIYDQSYHYDENEEPDGRYARIYTLIVNPDDTATLKIIDKYELMNMSYAATLIKDLENERIIVDMQGHAIEYGINRDENNHIISIQADEFDGTSEENPYAVFVKEDPVVDAISGAWASSEDNTIKLLVNSDYTGSKILFNKKLESENYLIFSNNRFTLNGITFKFNNFTENVNKLYLNSKVDNDEIRNLIADYVANSDYAYNPEVHGESYDASIIVVNNMSVEVLNSKETMCGIMAHYYTSEEEINSSFGLICSVSGGGFYWLEDELAEEMLDEVADGTGMYYMDNENKYPVKLTTEDVCIDLPYMDLQIVMADPKIMNIISKLCSIKPIENLDTSLIYRYQDNTLSSIPTKNDLDLVENKLGTEISGLAEDVEAGLGQISDALPPIIKGDLFNKDFVAEEDKLYINIGDEDAPIDGIKPYTLEFNQVHDDTIFNLVGFNGNIMADGMLDNGTPVYSDSTELSAFAQYYNVNINNESAMFTMPEMGLVIGKWKSTSGKEEIRFPGFKTIEYTLYGFRDDKNYREKIGDTAESVKFNSNNYILTLGDKSYIFGNYQNIDSNTLRGRYYGYTNINDSEVRFDIIITTNGYIHIYSPYSSREYFGMNTLGTSVELEYNGETIRLSKDNFNDLNIVMASSGEYDSNIGLPSNLSMNGDSSSNDDGVYSTSDGSIKYYKNIAGTNYDFAYSALVFTYTFPEYIKFNSNNEYLNQQVECATLKINKGSDISKLYISDLSDEEINNAINEYRQSAIPAQAYGDQYAMYSIANDMSFPWMVNEEDACILMYMSSDEPITILELMNEDSMRGAIWSSSSFQDFKKGWNLFGDTVDTNYIELNTPIKISSLTNEGKALLDKVFAVSKRKVAKHDVIYKYKNGNFESLLTESDISNSNGYYYSTVKIEPSIPAHTEAEAAPNIVDSIYIESGSWEGIDEYGRLETTEGEYRTYGNTSRYYYNVSRSEYYQYTNDTVEVDDTSYPIFIYADPDGYSIGSLSFNENINPTVINMLANSINPQFMSTNSSGNRYIRLFTAVDLTGSGNDVAFYLIKFATGDVIGRSNDGPAATEDLYILSTSTDVNGAPYYLSGSLAYNGTVMYQAGWLTGVPEVSSIISADRVAFKNSGDVYEAYTDKVISLIKNFISVDKGDFITVSKTQKPIDVSVLQPITSNIKKNDIVMDTTGSLFSISDVGVRKVETVSANKTFGSLTVNDDAYIYLDVNSKPNLEELYSELGSGNYIVDSDSNVLLKLEHQSYNASTHGTDGDIYFLKVFPSESSPKSSGAVYYSTNSESIRAMYSMYYQMDDSVWYVNTSLMEKEGDGSIYRNKDGNHIIDGSNNVIGNSNLLSSFLSPDNDWVVSDTKYIDVFTADRLVSFATLLSSSIKSINGNTLLGSGDLDISSMLVNVGGYSLKKNYNGDDFDTNIPFKTINNQSVVGDGNITISTDSDLKLGTYSQRQARIVNQVASSGSNLYNYVQGDITACFFQDSDSNQYDEFFDYNSEDKMIYVKIDNAYLYDNNEGTISWSGTLVRDCPVKNLVISSAGYAYNLYIVYVDGVNAFDIQLEPISFGGNQGTSTYFDQNATVYVTRIA